MSKAFRYNGLSELPGRGSAGATMMRTHEGDQVADRFLMCTKVSDCSFRHWLQVVDTVVIYRLLNQRKLRLRFLASYVLRQDIQQTTHDSIEDARAAVLLLHEARRLQAAGTFKQKLQVAKIWSIYGWMGSK